jgi:pantoate--beta-alanine ligase
MPTIVDSIPSWRARRASLDGRRIGFVPTLGGLHAGHASLIERSVRENEVTVLSVFLNPTQFDKAGDLAAYPADFEKDRALARSLGVDYVFCPGPDEIYPDGYRYRVSESELSRGRCGAHRPGHFDGVLTVVLKLLQIVRPDRAYFGEKDYQQLELVRGMVRAFFVPVEIVACPTVREADGLAASSRNSNLTTRERRLAPAFPELLRSQASAAEVSRQLEAAGFGVDYVEDLDGRRFGAVRLGRVRLIDNIPLPDAPGLQSGGHT